MSKNSVELMIQIIKENELILKNQYETFNNFLNMIDAFNNMKKEFSNIVEIQDKEIKKLNLKVDEILREINKSTNYMRPPGINIKPH